MTARFDEAGGLDRRVELLKFDASSRDALNAPVPAWTSAGTFWARQMTQRALEVWQAGTSAGQVEIVFRLRFSAVTAAIEARDRIETGVRTFEVVGVPTEPVRRKFIDVAVISVPA